MSIFTPRAQVSSVIGWVIGKIVAGIKVCGRHPLAAGVFALLGLIALLLSVAGYRLDRQEAQDTTELIVGLKNDLVQNDHFDWITIELTNSFDKFEQKNGVGYCTPPETLSLDTTRDFVEFLLKHQGKIAVVDFTWEVQECQILEKTEISTLDDKPVVLTMRAGHYSDYAANVHKYKHLDVGSSYVEKAENVFSSAFTIYFETKYTHKNLVDEYIVTLWPPVSELHAHNHFADEYGLNKIVGLFKVKVTHGGGIGIELVPVEAIDVDKYERTLELIESEREK